MDEQTNAPRQSPEDRGKARQDSTSPSAHSVTTDDKQFSPRRRRRHSGRATRPPAQSSAAQRNTLRRRSSSRSESFGPHGGSSRDIPATMQRSYAPSEPDAITYTPTTRRVSKAKKGKRVHACEFPGCDKVFTRAEHRRRHELNHSPEPYQCGVPGCQKTFHRPDLLNRHMERQHNDTESHRDYRHGRSMSQVSMAESDPANTVMATTVPPLSPSMLESATQPSSAMSIYSIVDHNTPPGFITQPMDTLNDLSQLAVPAGPHGFPPELVYGPTSDESPFYSSDSCYSPNPEYSHARIAGQSYLPRHNSQHPPSFTPYMGPCYQPPLYSTSTLPAWCDTDNSLPPQELPGTDHFEGSFLQPVGTSAPPRDDSQNSPSHTRYIYEQPLYLPSVVPAWCETETSPNEGSGTNPSSASSKPGPDTAWNTPVTSIEATTSASAEPQRRHTTSRSTRQSHHMDHGTPNQQSPPTPSLQSMSTYYDPPRKRRRESSSTTAVYSASSGNLDELQLHFDAPLMQGVNNIVDKKAETNEKAEAAGAAEEAQRSDPAQAVNHLLRKWTTLFDTLSAPSWESGWQSAVS